jgi:hypothetical protein
MYNDKDGYWEYTEFKIGQDVYFVKKILREKTIECDLCVIYGDKDLILNTSSKPHKGYIHIKGQLYKCPKCNGIGVLTLSDIPIWEIESDITKIYGITISNSAWKNNWEIKYTINDSEYTQINNYLKHIDKEWYAFKTLEEAQKFCGEKNNEK